MKNTIAVCIARIDENFQTDALKALCKKADENGFSIQVYNSFEELIDHDRYDQGEESVYELINYDRLCGIILFAEKIKDNDLNQRIIDSGKEHGIPVVSIDRHIDECYCITFDYVNSFEQIVRHLLEVHHCKNFYVMGGFRNNSFSDERIDVVRRVIGEYGLRLTADDIGYGDFWEEPCRAVMKEFFESGRPLPDAFIAANDTMAITICDELTKAGYRVPEDTIVTGFDGIEMERYVVPRLTTAQQNIDSAAEAAVEVIDQIRKGIPDVQRKYVIPFSIRYSQSCGCKPVEYRRITTQINKVYNDLTACRQFNKFMYEMVIDMTSEKTIGGMVKYLERYFTYLTGYRHIYVCVRQSMLDGDEKLMQEIEHVNRNVADKKDMDMVVLCEYHEDSGFQVPLTGFSQKEQLPNYEIAIQRMKHIVFIPLHMQETVFGYMALDLSPENNVYYQLNHMVMNLSHCLESVRQKLRNRKINEKLRLVNDKLEELYIRDPLTGIYNRRGFYQEIHRKIKKYKYGWIMMASVDLDGLKQINDKYGHSEGDFAIKSVGKAIACCCGENGIYARFGGDEFSAALFFNEYEESAEQNWKQKLIRQLTIINEQSGKPYQIGASCGTDIAVIDNELDLDALLRTADDKMYSNKEEHHRGVIRARPRI